MWGFIVGFPVLMLAAAVFFSRHVIKRLGSVESSLVADRREEKLFKLYSEIEDMLDCFEEYVGEVHEELEGKREELAEISRRASSLFMQAEDRFAQLADFQPQIRLLPLPKASQQSLQQTAPQTTPKSTMQTILQAPSQKPLTAPKSDPSRRDSKLTAQDRGTLKGLKTKTEKVRFIMGKGLSLEEAARELGIGKGEVRLIASLSS